MPNQVHWHEGLFLQPHHLQRMQKSLLESTSAERRLAWAYPYGVVEMRVSRDELENFRIRFDKLRVIMPSGVEVSFPDYAELPSLDIKQTFASSGAGFNVYLGVPLWQEGRANTLNPGDEADPRAKVLYRLKEVEYADENTGLNPKPLQLRQINARLLLEGEDQSDMEVLPLLRIRRGTGDEGGMPRQDPDYVPPCMVLGGSTQLRELVRDLVAQVEAHRKELVVQLTRGGFSLDTLRGVQFEQLLRLRTLNRYSARLPSLLAAPMIQPFVMYVEFRGLLGELVALKPDRDEFDCGPYDHDNPYPCFQELKEKILDHVRGSVAAAYIKVDFQDVSGQLTAKLLDEHFTQPNAYLLAIKTKNDPSALARYVVDADKFKLMPQSLATRAIRGVELKEERHPPLELPAAPDLYYFRLDRTSSARMWDMIKTEKTVVVRWTGAELDWSGAIFTLYMTIPAST